MIRKATIQDIKDIHKLLQELGGKGKLLPRPLSQLYDHIRNFSVYVHEGNFAGCCSLSICWEDLAEIRSLAVKKEYQGMRIGEKLVKSKLPEAEELGIKKIFTLTYVPDFFKKLEFKPIEKYNLPLKIWADCIHCVKFPHCDEISLIKTL